MEIQSWMHEHCFENCHEVILKSWTLPITLEESSIFEILSSLSLSIRILRLMHTPAVFVSRGFQAKTRSLGKADLKAFRLKRAKSLWSSSSLWRLKCERYFRASGWQFFSLGNSKEREVKNERCSEASIEASIVSSKKRTFPWEFTSLAKLRVFFSWSSTSSSSPLQ